MDGVEGASYAAPWPRFPLTLTLYHGVEMGLLVAVQSRILVLAITAQVDSFGEFGNGRR